jgi:RNA polymerase sigma-70 factor (ECF subfamily)
MKAKVHVRKYDGNCKVIETIDYNFEFEIENIQTNLFSFILSLVPHRQDAEDLLQKTNYILCEKQKTFDPTLGEFKSWAFKIAKYQVMAYRTKHYRSKISFSNELTENLAQEYIDHVTPHLKKEALNRCYEKLPEHMQTIAQLRFKDSLSLQEISASTERPIGAVSATLHRIRANLMKCIKGAYQEVEQEYYK